MKTMELLHALFSVVKAKKKPRKVQYKGERRRVLADQTRRKKKEARTPTGTNRFIWQHSGNPNPRPEHLARDGEIIEWDDWDEEWPGEWANCGCKAIPLHDDEDVEYEDE